MMDFGLFFVLSSGGLEIWHTENLKIGLMF